MLFNRETLDLFDRTDEVEVETRAADGTIHRAVVWVVVDGDDVFLRSYRGVRGRWYREALADPGVAIHVAGRRVPARAVPAPDDESIARASAELARKYAGDPSARAMLREQILGQTLRLEPA